MKSIASVVLFAIVVSITAVAADHGAYSDRTLRIAGGDLLDVAVFDVPELSGKFRVSNTGSVSLPLVGEIRLEQMSAAEVEHAIAKKLVDGGFVRAPQVSVMVQEFATQGVSVLGEVKKPGIYPSFGEHRLLDYLSMAEGLTPLAGSTAYIARHGVEQSEKVALRAKGAMRENPEVLAGDTIVVERAGVVYVVGDVMRPGGFPMDQENRLTVLQAVALAQGANRTAALKSAKLIRTTEQGKVEVPINVSAILDSKAPDISLKDEDILFIPNSAAKTALKRGLEAGIQAAVGVAIYGRY